MLLTTSIFRRLMIALAMLAVSSLPVNVARADEPMLIVSGEVIAPATGGALEFSVEDIHAMASTTFTTSTIWTKGENRFKGVLLKEFLASIGADGATLRATAANAYSVDIPTSDAVEGGPILAYEMDDKQLTIRNKGPLWIVYPYDQNVDYQSESIYSRSIWQVTSIEIIE